MYPAFSAAEIHKLLLCKDLKCFACIMSEVIKNLYKL